MADSTAEKESQHFPEARKVETRNGVVLVGEKFLGDDKIIIFASDHNIAPLKSLCCSLGNKDVRVIRFAEPFSSLEDIIRAANTSRIWILPSDAMFLLRLYNSAGDYLEPFIGSAFFLPEFAEVNGNLVCLLLTLFREIADKIRSENKEQIARQLKFLVRLSAYGKKEIEQDSDFLGMAPALRQGLGSLSAAFLSVGELELGTWLYEARKLEEERDGVRPFDFPAWSGEPLSGKSVLLWRNHGPGDEIFCASTYRDIFAAARQVYLEVDPRLVSLFRRSFPDAKVFARSSPPNQELLNAGIDYQIATSATFRYVRRTIEDFPKPFAYLTPDPVRVRYWRRYLAERFAGNRVVGISWRSNADAHPRYITNPGNWETMLARKGVAFVNLQYGEFDRELAAVQDRLGIDIPRLPGLDIYNDFEELAAVLMALDVFVSIDNTTSNLSGAVGARVIQLTERFREVTFGEESCLMYPEMVFVFTDGRPTVEVIVDADRALEKILLSLA